MNSDPTAGTLAGASAEMAKNSQHIDKILKETAKVDVADFRALEALSYLNGVIVEAVRLYPSLLSGGS